ncbi:MAG: hypothetical protein JJT77_12380, partial [Crocinitomicaceae bacterium]|nr:hypothetical protein [Crocinitomicaceae bacterium]
MSYWIPDEATPIKTIKIAFHVFNDDNGDGTIFLNNAQGITDIELTVERLNDVYSNVAEPTNPKQGVDELIDTKIRFSLEEIYFYDDDTFNTCLPSSFSVRSNMLNYIINNHPERLEYLPILIGEFNCKPPHANLPSPSFLGSSSNLDMMSYNFMGPSSLWSASRTLTHELGHNLDLRHTYVPGETCNQSSQEYLSDFFDSSLGGGTDCLHDAGWDCDIEDASNTCTNNIMGGVNKTLYYFSPLQIGRIHRALSIKSVRKYIKDSP